LGKSIEKAKLIIETSIRTEPHKCVNEKLRKKSMIQLKQGEVLSADSRAGLMLLQCAIVHYRNFLLATLVVSEEVLSINRLLDTHLSIVKAKHERLAQSSHRREHNSLKSLLEERSIPFELLNSLSPLNHSLCDCMQQQFMYLKSVIFNFLYYQ
jgi:hypothetical protein